MEKEVSFDFGGTGSFGSGKTSSSSDSEEEFDEEVEMGLEDLLLETQKENQGRKKSRMPGRNDRYEPEENRKHEYQRDSLDLRLSTEAEDSRIAVLGVLRLKVQNLLIENQQLRQDRENQQIENDREKNLLEQEINTLKLHLDHQYTIHATAMEKLQRTHDHEMDMFELEQEKQHISEDNQFQEDLEQKVLEMQNQMHDFRDRESELMDQLDASAILVQGLKEDKQNLTKDLQRHKRAAEQRDVDEEKMKLLEERNEVLEKQIALLKTGVKEQAEEMVKAFVREKKKIVANHRKVIENLKEEVMEVRTQMLAERRAMSGQKAEVKLLRAETEKLRVEARKAQVLDALNIQMGNELGELKKLVGKASGYEELKAENRKLELEVKDAMKALDKSKEKWTEAQKEIAHLRQVETESRKDWRRVVDIQTELNTLRGGVNATNYRQVQEQMLELKQSNQALVRRNDDLQTKLDQFMISWGPNENDVLHLREELSAARSHAMASRQRAFDYIDRISELEASEKGLYTHADLQKRIADLETELSQQVKIVYHLEQERIAVSNMKEVRKMLESIPLPPIINQRLSNAFQKLEIRNEKLPTMLVKGSPDKKIKAENDKLKRKVKVLQNELMHLEDQLDLRREDSALHYSSHPYPFKRSRGAAASPFATFSPLSDFPDSSRSRQVSREHRFNERPVE